MKKLISLVLLFAISAFAGLADYQSVDLIGWSDRQDLVSTDLVYRGVPPVTLYPEPQDTTYKVIKINSKLFITKEYRKIDTLRIGVK